MRSSSRARPDQGDRLLFLYTPLVQMGGAERNFLEEVRQFRSRGTRADAVTFRPAAADASELAGVADDITVIPTNGALSTVAALRTYIKRTQPQMVVAHTNPILAYLGTLGTGVPYVIYLNSSPFYKGYPENQVILSWRHTRLLKEVLQRDGPRYGDFLRPVALGPLRRLEVEARAAATARAVRNARAVIVWSRRVADEVRQVYGVEAVVLRGCIPDALPEHVPASDIRDRLRLPRSSRVLLTVSRLDAIKRIDLLIHAFAELKHSHPDAVLVIVGTGPDADRLRAVTAAVGATDVIFAGFVPDDALRDYYATSDVFVTPALADFNLTPFEALALRCRVVWSTEMEGDAALLDSGVVVEAEPTAEAFAAAIARALGQPRPSKAAIEPYLWSHRHAHLASLYASILHSVKSPAA